MKQSKSSGINTPFENLKSLLKSKSVRLHSFPVEKVFLNKKFRPENDEALFDAAMADVSPIDKKNLFEFEKNKIPAEIQDQENADNETLAELQNLVVHGQGFVVENTPEYMAGMSPDICREVVKKIHQGEYSIQGFVDLHGLRVAEAHEVFEEFMRESVVMGKRGVLVVHGRGLSSPDEPVLKTRVYQWLTKGPWRKWVMAFSSARLCDGGAGATVVLLRRRPVSKRQQKKRLSAYQFFGSPEKKHPEHDRTSQRSCP